jgi:predicted Fe-Mo cluster-binding NifX family protein
MSSYRIAIASSDGESVNQHFAQAENFLIYEVSDDGVVFIEDREVNVNSEEKLHSDTKIEIITNLLKDCKAVFVLKIGERAIRYLYVNGIKSFPVNYSLNRIFTTLVKRQNGRVRIL